LIAYVDTSALGRLLLREPSCAAILDTLAAYDRRAASGLARVELCRLALRTDRLGDANRLLSGVALIPVDTDVLAAAETLSPAAVATLDAIHLVTALRLADADRLDALLTYDRRLADGAREHGITVLAP